MTLDVLPRALADTHEAYSHLAADDQAVADRFLEALEKAYDLIERNPNVGRPGRIQPVREWSIPKWPYIIPYRIVGDDIEVLRIWHTRRDKPEIWG